MSYNLRSRKRLKVEAPGPDPPVEKVKKRKKQKENVEPRNRALANEYILAEVMGYLSVKDLRACRLVNKVWTEVATRVIAPKAVVNLEKNSDLSRVVEFMKTRLPVEDLPCRKFNFGSGLLRNASAAEQLLFPKFIEKVAPVALQLGVSSLTARLFPWGKPKEGTGYPKLKSLKLDAYLMRYEGIRYDCDDYMKKVERRYETLKSNVDYMINVLGNSPALNNVSVRVGREEMHRQYEDDEFLRIMDHVPWNQLDHLKLDFRLVDEHFQKMMELGADMKLKSFEMFARMLWERHDHRNRIGEDGFFPQFLERQSSSLESLKLYFGRILEAYGLTVPWPTTFPKLKTLKIDVEIYDDYFDQKFWFRFFSPLTFSAQRFPVLSSLTVNNFNFYEVWELFSFPGFTPLETVKKLTLDLWMYREDGAEEQAEYVVYHLANFFPCVQELGVPADLNIMKAIEKEKQWEDLKSLTLFCGHNINDNVDSVLTGYSPEECKRISELELGSLEFQQEKRKMGRRIFKFLRNLETLELSYSEAFEHNRTSSKFSDLSCRLVLLKMKNLKTLDLRGICRHQRHTLKEVTKPMIQEMRKKFKVYTDLSDDGN